MTLSPKSLPDQSEQSSYSDFEGDVLPTNQVGDTAAPAVMVQQRQILAMMGLDIWVHRDSPTVSVDYDTYQGQNIEPEFGNELQPTAVSEAKNEVSEATNNAFTPELSPQPDTDTNTNTNQVSVNNPVTAEVATNKTLARNPIQALKQKLDVKEDNDNTNVKISLADSLQQVEPFEIVGAHFKNWVLIADIVALKDQQKLTLWENIIAALSLTPESLKFPICEGINDKESANASVAGFIFRLAKNNEVNVAALTAMPESIGHANIKQTPTLADMLANSELKKQFWQSLIQN